MFFFHFWCYGHEWSAFDAIRTLRSRMVIGLNARRLTATLVSGFARAFSRTRSTAQGLVKWHTSDSWMSRTRSAAKSPSLLSPRDCNTRRHCIPKEFYVIASSRSSTSSLSSRLPSTCLQTLDPQGEPSQHSLANTLSQIILALAAALTAGCLAELIERRPAMRNVS